MDAFKKTECPNIGVDKSQDHEMHKHVRDMLELADMDWKDTQKWCMNWNEFGEALLKLEENGKAKYLNPHLKPQHNDCFSEVPAEMWTQTAMIDTPGAAKMLAPHLGIKMKIGEKGDFPRSEKKTKIELEDWQTRLVDK